MRFVKFAESVAALSQISRALFSDELDLNNLIAFFLMQFNAR